MDTNDNTRANAPETTRKSAPPAKKAVARPENGAPRKESAQSGAVPAQKPKRPARTEEQRDKRREPAKGKEKDGARRETVKRAADTPRPTPARREVPKSTEDASDEVYHPKQDGRRRPASENPPERTGKKASPSKKAKKGSQEDQYQPYRAANQRKKAQKKQNLRKFFSSENPILRRFGAGNRDAFAEDSDLARKRKEQRAADAARKKKKQSPLSAPAVVYTDPLPFNRDRLLVQLLTIVAVVLAFVLGLSVFFRVETITISGAGVYSPYTIQEASGIKKGDNLLTFGRARASGQITANLPYVKSVRIGIKLPDTVNIEVEEENVVYAIKSEEGIWWLINSDGKVVSMSNNSEAKNYTQLVGVTLMDPQVNEPGVAAEAVPTETTEDGEFVPVLVTGAQRLSAALQIVKALEDNDIVGEAASVDVSRLDDMILWYGTRYQVNLGDTSQIENKIAYMCDAILQMSDYQTGVLDISFTIWPDQIGYTPFQ